MNNVLKKWNSLSLVLRIFIGMIAGIALGIITSFWSITFLSWVGLLGDLFVSSLKAVAPILVLFLVMSAILQQRKGQKTNMKSVLLLYGLAMLLASLTSIIMSFVFPVTLELGASASDVSPPSGIIEVFRSLLLNIVSNPITSLGSGNYIGILAWAVILGFAFRHASSATKQTIGDISDALSKVVTWVISLAPLGIMGLVFQAVADGGLGALSSYVHLLSVLLGTMLLVALVVNPLIVFVMLRKNPYPLVFRTLKESGITAFFTRSSAANIPVNMKLCEAMGLDKDTYAISIPLGATVNMSGAAVTITILSLAAAHTLGISIDLPSAFLLSVVAALSACGSSGVAGGSLLLIPLATGLFGIPENIALQVVGIGFVIGILQDSAETALNSSGDVLFTATADAMNKRKQKSLQEPNV